MERWLIMASMVLAATFTRESMVGVCQGKFINPITGTYWNCLLPLTLGGTPTTTMDQGDTDNPDGFLYTCIDSLRIGIKIGFQELARHVDVIRTPYCFVSLGSIKLDPDIHAPEGEIRS